MRSIISTILSLGIFFSLYETLKTKNTYQGFETWTMKDAELLKDLPNRSETISGKSRSITNVQGMNVGKSYIYSAKIHNSINAIAIYRTTIDSKARVLMNCYPNTKGSKRTYCTEAGHANDLLVINKTGTGTNILLAATSDTNGLARYIIDGQNLYFIGYLNVKGTDGKNLKVNAVRQFRHADNYFYLIFKWGETFYYGKVNDNDTYFPEKTTSGSEKNTLRSMTIYKIATLDKKNAVFAGSNSSYEYYGNMESWGGQGFSYNPTEKTIYAPYFEQSSGNVKTNAILRYYVGDIFVDKNMDYKTDRNIIRYPTMKNFLLKNTDYSKTKDGLEVESCGFRIQYISTDTKLYFQINGFPDESDGIYFIKNFQGNSKNYTSVADNKTTYTVQYVSDENTNQYHGMYSTRHIYGIKSNLRANNFTRSNYKFTGWNLKRKIDDLWLYENKSTGSRNWYKKGQQPSGYSFALYGNKRGVSELTSKNNDVVYCYAQWEKN
ncbi:hypothetical protein H8356DRAFT_1688253 [Neocallimastix lanati (nom. inval.)]|nr:hypothetical protein H8356DRAFT_1688253 [Neocallimastix sp. JGI-2020a]